MCGRDLRHGGLDYLHGLTSLDEVLRVGPQPPVKRRQNLLGLNQSDAHVVPLVREQTL